MEISTSTTFKQQSVQCVGSKRHPYSIQKFRPNLQRQKTIQTSKNYVRTRRVVPFGRTSRFPDWICCTTFWFHLRRAHLIWIDYVSVRALVVMLVWRVPFRALVNDGRRNFNSSSGGPGPRCMFWLMRAVNRRSHVAGFAVDAGEGVEARRLAVFHGSLAISEL